MIAPENIKKLELLASTLWFDENGILCSIAKNVPQTLEEAKEAMTPLRDFIGPGKVCMLADNTRAAPVNKQMRDFAADVLPQFIKALAVLSQSPVGKMTANLFFALKKQPYPIKFFNSETEAKEWLKQYL
jgi:hypothetical protein